jgi:integrase
VHLDTAAQIEALLDAAELDCDPRRACADRRAIVATLILAGPRAHELGYLLWRDIDLANGRIRVGRSKTQAGLREIKIRPILRDILAAYKASAYRSGPDDLVFPTSTSGRRNKATCASRSCWRPSSAPTICLSAAATCRCPRTSPPTSCATPSPRC